MTSAVCQATHDFPGDELGGLASQMRRCAGSIPANIAEGCGQGSNSDLARFLQMAMGSASELEYHLLLTRDRGLLDDAEFTRLNQEAVEVKRMLAPFIRKLPSLPPSPHRATPHVTHSSPADSKVLLPSRSKPATQHPDHLTA